MDAHLISYYTGITVVFSTHLYILIKGNMLDAHAIANVLAGLMIAYYFLNKEKFIKF